MDTQILEKEKLPQIDTIFALDAVAAGWHTQFVPLILSLFI